MRTANPSTSPTSPSFPLMDQESSGPPRPNYSEIIRPTLQYELYNAADHTIEFMFDGRPFRVPAHDKHWHGKDPHTGVEIVYPKPGVLPIWGPSPIPGKRIEYTARDIVAFACGPDGISGSVGGLGVRPLFGDERDQLVAEEAQSAWAERRRFDAEQMIRAHEAKVRDAKEAGTPPPYPGRKVLEAYSLRNAYESQLAFKFTCPICNMGFRDSQTEVYVHTITFHKDRRDDVIEAQEQLSKVKNPETGQVEQRPLGKTDLTPEEAGPAFERPLPASAQNMGAILDEVGGKEPEPPVESLKNTGAKIPVPPASKK